MHTWYFHFKLRLICFYKIKLSVDYEPKIKVVSGKKAQAYTKLHYFSKRLTKAYIEHMFIHTSG